jgi:hypothetical protein
MSGLSLAAAPLLSVPAFLLILGTYYAYKRRYALPGPRGYPIIGNVFDMPKSREWLHWARHKDVYGTLALKFAHAQYFNYMF